ncbi:manganese efflux pump MntP family protein [uncultured Veillonella sp.]|uniref:manganese efflux pump MntP n=1 Tax=uncultured Veillonella sp. TaxID=159268 RepID=UPI00260D7960|nr:manganese efflux pump MntP family protein [uncultured Veillonella sp.]
MSLWEIAIVAVSLAMDAFAVAIAKGPCISDKEPLKRIGLPFLFGLFQMIMPLIGWVIGAQLAGKIDDYDHWIIFALLGYLGINMIRNSCKPVEEGDIICHLVKWREMFVLAFATSIDALAIGITLAFFSVNVWTASSMIGIITFVISLGGVFLGQQLAKLLSGRAEMIGGFVLILIGLKILLQHLGILTLAMI